MRLLIVFLAFITILSCKKKDDPVPVIPDPVACFTTSKTTVMVGESLTATNCSANATSYLWEDGDGFSNTSTDRSIKYNSAGTYTLKLTAQGNGKTNITSKVITVVPAMGDVTFWQSGTPSYNTTTVTIAGVSRQITSDYPSGATSCGAAGCANFYLSTGNHTFTATDGTYTWNGTVTVGINNCVKFQLQ